MTAENQQAAMQAGGLEAAVSALTNHVRDPAVLVRADRSRASACSVPRLEAPRKDTEPVAHAAVWHRPRSPAGGCVRRDRKYRLVQSRRPGTYCIEQTHLEPLTRNVTVADGGARLSHGTRPAVARAQRRGGEAGHACSVSPSRAHRPAAVRAPHTRTHTPGGMCFSGGRHCWEDLRLRVGSM